MVIRRLIPGDEGLGAGSLLRRECLARFIVACRSSSTTSNSCPRLVAAAHYSPGMAVQTGLSFDLTAIVSVTIDKMP